MPIALLLTAPVDALRRGIKRWAPWQGLAESEALVLRRWRGRFLTNWFGTALPLAGVTPLVAVANLGELRARLRGMHGRGVGPNGRTDDAGLLEPLLGSGGMLVGLLATPLTSVAATGAALRAGAAWWRCLLAVLAAPLASVGISIVGLLGPIGVAWTLGTRALAGDHALFDVMRLGAGIGPALQPIFGGIAWLFSRVVPLVPLLVDVALSLRSLMTGIAAMLGDIARSIPDTITALFGPEGAALGALIAGLGGLRHAMTGLTARFRTLRDAVTTAFSPVTSPLRTFATRFVPGDVIRKHPLVVAVGGFSRSLPVLGAHWKDLITTLPLWIGDIIVALTKPSSGPASWLTLKKTATDRAVAAARLLTAMPEALPPLPAVPTFAALPTAALTRASAGAPSPTLAAITDAFTAASAAAGRRAPSVLPPAGARVRREVSDAHDRFAEVARSLELARTATEPHASPMIRSLEDVLVRVEATMDASRSAYPVKDVASTLPLRLHVTELAVEGAATSPAGVRRFADRVRAALAQQTFSAAQVL